jgi:hypothetical protein
MKIRSVEAELFRADVQTDMTKLTVAFGILRMRPQSGENRNNNKRCKVLLKVSNKEARCRNSWQP